VITAKMAKGMNKNEVILELLRTEGPLSTHEICARFRALDLRLSTGQALTRLRDTLARRNPPAVEEVEGARGRLWRIPE
jgi:hypothetical protein